MSKQVTLSAAAAVLSMALMALVAAQGTFATGTAAGMAGSAPLFELTVSR